MNIAKAAGAFAEAVIRKWNRTMLLCAIALLAIAMSVGLAEARMHKRMVPGVHGGQAGGCAMRVRYGSWPPIGVPEGAMVPFLRTCLHAVKARIHRRKRQVAILKKLAMDSFFLGERN